MTDTLQLYALAETAQIPVLSFRLPECESLSLQSPDGSCWVGLDPTLPTAASERVHLAHELGHCFTGSFYNRYAAIEHRQKLKHHADKWAIEALIPPAAYAAALADGDTALWQLAERFCVTEDFARKAVCWYQHGNLAVESYDWPD